MSKPQSNFPFPLSTTVHLHGPIDHHSISKLIEQIFIIKDMIQDEVSLPMKVKDRNGNTVEAVTTYSELPDIKLRVSSGGGTVSDMLSLLDVMTMVKKERTLRTLAAGYIMSAAIPIIAFGTPGKRFAGENCRFMIHGVSSGAWGTIPEMKDSMAETEFLQNYYRDFMKEYTKFPMKKFDEIVESSKNFYFSAEQAKEFGIIDKIIKLK